MPNHNENLEQLLDLIAEHLIQSNLVNSSIVEDSQKYIRNGTLQQGAEGEGVLALFQKDVKANQEDLNSLITINPETDEEETLPTLQNLANIVDFNLLTISSSLGTDNTVSVFMIGGGLPGAGQDITDLVIGDGNPLNVSQFIPLQQSSSIVDIDRAEEFLDTNIFELLPTGDTRQSRIIRFFQELNALLPSQLPEFDLDGELGVDRGPDGRWLGDLEYQQNNSISYAQDNQDGNIDEEDAFIHRLKSTANDTNSSRTIEDIYNTILPYLTDILEDPIELEDIPTYQNQSSGYLQFRNPNQGIIIRNTNQDFVQGLDPSNPTYLETGFTITMWVRFLDKVSEGTLFNFGNPTLGKTSNSNQVSDTTFGFSLETFVLPKDGETSYTNYPTWGDIQNSLANYNTNVYDSSNSARFVRLVVRDNDYQDVNGNIGNLRDSCVGFSALGQKLNITIPMKPDLNVLSEYTSRLFGATFIPQDFDEWYFICASFNPSIKEDESHDNGMTTNQGNATTEETPEYWLNHIVPPGIDSNTPFTNNSGYGNKCKVEIISRTDLLRARGFKVD